MTPAKLEFEVAAGHIVGRLDKMDVYDTVRRCYLDYAPVCTITRLSNGLYDVWLSNWFSKKNFRTGIPLPEAINAVQSWAGRRFKIPD